jgi:starch synthase
LIKTGGLADVSGSLPPALKNLRRDVRLIMPGYRQAIDNAGAVRPVAELDLPGIETPVRLLECELPGTRIPVWLVDSPVHFDRNGGPYADEHGADWRDNAQRFTAFCRAVEAVALDRAGLAWRPDVVHCNDWQSGLVPALLADAPDRPATVFTIHNLSYQGLFPRNIFEQLGLPSSFWSMHGLEFYGQLSFIKGGIVFADMISTVSPNYAREICTPEYGCGLETLLTHRADRLVGILNGADYSAWNPARDRYITQTYNAHTLHNKAANKTALQRQFSLPVDVDVPLLGLIGRLVEQKGFDLLLDAIPKLITHPLQIVILGSGDKILEARLREAMAAHPRQIAARIGYDEPLAHQIEAGADLFLLPSRYEPCGLNQIYSLRYGTVPVVRRTGGLANTVIDATETTLQSGTATGFVFDLATSADLLATLMRALACYKQPRTWKRLAYMGMQQDFSWRQSARNYLDLYQRAITAVSSATPQDRV